MTDEEFANEAKDKINGPITALCDKVEELADYMQRRSVQLIGRPNVGIDIIQDFNVAAATMRELCKVTRHLSDLPAMLGTATEQ